MMNCQQLVELMLDFVAGDLEPDFHAEIEHHLLQCPSCDAYVHSYRVTITITRKLPPRPMSTQFAQRLEQMLREIEE